MATRNDVINVDELWDIFDAEREKAWDGVTAQPGEPEWNIAVEKIKTINNICEGVFAMNVAERSNGDKALPPVWKKGSSVVHTDYMKGSGTTTVNNWAAWTCPKCGEFVGEQFIPRWVGQKPHNQRKCNFCSRCGQKIDWAKVEGMK